MSVVQIKPIRGSLGEGIVQRLLKIVPVGTGAGILLIHQLIPSAKNSHHVTHTKGQTCFICTVLIYVQQFLSMICEGIVNN
jgi:hypothetical protein